MKFQNFVQRRLRNVQKSMMHVQSCCFVNINLLLFNCSWCGRRRCCLSSLLLWYRNFATMVTWRHASAFYRRVVLNSSPLPSPHPQYYRPLFSHRQFTVSSVWIQNSSHIKLVINLDILFLTDSLVVFQGEGNSNDNPFLRVFKLVLNTIAVLLLAGVISFLVKV